MVTVVKRLVSRLDWSRVESCKILAKRGTKTTKPLGRWEVGVLSIDTSDLNWLCKFTCFHLRCVKFLQAFFLGFDVTQRR